MTATLTPNTSIDAEVFVARTEYNSMYTTSKDIAKNFGKQHKHVLRSIKDLVAQNWTTKNMFHETTYTNRGKQYPVYYITRDGFSLLVMGFTGAKALEWKLKYLTAFKRMEDIIRNELNAYTGQPKRGTKEFLAMALLDAQQIINDQTKQLEDAKPAIVFHEAVAVAENTILVRELATIVTKALRDNGFNVHIGEKKLYEWLRNNGYVIKQKCASYNLPTSKSTKLDVLTVKESVRNGDHDSHTETCTRVTGKGQQYFIDKFLELYSNGGYI